MDLCTRHVSAETFEYRHKKFDQVRGSPIPVKHRRASMPAFKEEARSMAGTPYSFISNSTCRKNFKRDLEDNDTTWEPSADDFDLPRTPTKRQRMQSRSSRNKRPASYELCNAPKKHKSAKYVAHDTTPQKSTEAARTTPSLMPEISKETLARICQYNKNMVRKFPKRERSARDQERRDKNTIACRMSRRLKKLENLAVEEQYRIFTHEYLKQSKEAMHAAVYLNELLKYGGKMPTIERNGEIVESIAKKLGLHYLENISASATSKEFEIIDQNPFETKTIKVEKLTQRDIEEKSLVQDKLNVQQKRSFSIAFLLGNE